MKSRVKAYAKVNLFLDITGRLENGYHTLNTVMQQIDLYDIVTVEVNSGDNIRIECSEPAVPCNEKNIAYKAAKAYLSDIGENADISIKIEKNIPLEAGMGGSSTDGAAVLKALNEIYGKLTTAELCSLGAKLGADVPFCILGGTAVCTGIGEIMSPVNCRKDFVLAVIKPDFSCSTPAAYMAYDNSPLPKNVYFDSFVSDLPYGCEKWSGKMYNVFEKLYNSTKIASITALLKENGALGSILTGSGSAVFGVFKDKKTAENAIAKMNNKLKFVVNPI